MTRRLYQTDTYAAEFESAVTAIKNLREGYAVALEATLFYPEAGGQPSDTGFIEDSGVEGVLEEGDDIFHVVTGKHSFEVGERVKARIDWPRRFINMQQHTGQHILSQAFLKALNAGTASSKLGTEHSTIDVARLNLTWEDMERVEQLANSVVYENRPVKTSQIRPDQAGDTRAKKALAGDLLRLVEVEDFDRSPCGGTHCSNTGEVGLIKILRWEKVRDTSRVEFVCGSLAEADYFWKSRALTELAQAFTTKDSQVPGIVRDLNEAGKALRREVARLRARLAAYEISDLETQAETVSGVRIVRAILEDRSPSELRELAARLTQKGSTVALLGSRGESVHFVFSRSPDVVADMRQVIGVAASAVEGKGGGRPEVCEGGGKNPGRAEEAIKEAVDTLKRLLSA